MKFDNHRDRHLIGGCPPKKEVEIEPLSDDAFGKLMSSNEWTMGQAVALSEIVCE